MPGFDACLRKSSSRHGGWAPECLPACWHMLQRTPDAHADTLLSLRNLISYLFCFLKLQLHFSIKNGDGRTGHPDRLIFPFPSYEQIPSGKAHPDGRLEQSSLNSRNRRRTGTRAASQGFTRAPLVDSQPDMMRIDNLHISGIYSLRKT